MAVFGDLPLDILILIFPYLEPSEFLHLTSTCRSLSQTETRHEPSYWRHQTQAKFRVPNRPAVQSDGLRWQSLYKRLRTQSRVYTWGQNTHGCLGRDTTDQTYGMRPRRGPNLQPRIVAQPLTQQRSTWPREMGRARDIGVISDLQCGGWSTSLLTDDGLIHTVGVLNGMTQWNGKDELTPLSFDAINNELPKAHTAIKLFSSGRRHILALSDDGTIWSWSDATQPGCAVTFPAVDGLVTNVHAGWDRSSALVRGHGIVLWDIIRGGANVTEQSLQEFTVVPRTNYARIRVKARSVPEADELGDTIGEVTSYIVLEHYVLFVTHLHKLFAYRNRHTSEAGIMHDVFELAELSDAKDVQGSFRNFAVFRGEGEVVISNQDYLDACSRKAFQRHEDPLPDLMIIPAMQNTGVMQVAFGDYHYHALHSNGSISSYGTEPGGSGALGLGGAMDMDMPHGVLRGIKTSSWNFDGVLLPHCYAYGRRVWFQREQEEWIRFLANGGKDREEAKDRMRRTAGLAIAQAYMSEWVEQNGSNWHKRPEVQKVDEDGLGAYFALSVAAAGWHSGALVLVNDKVVDAVRESCMEDIPRPTTVTQTEEESTGRARSGSYLWDIARNFLGLQVSTDADDEAGQSERDRPQQRSDDGSLPKGKRWIWANQDYPRLTLDYNFQNPGEIEHADWRAPEGIRRFLFTGDERQMYGVKGWIREETESFVAT